MDNIYDNNNIDIYSETFDTDFDEIGWDPEIIDDSDSESEELFGL